MKQTTESQNIPGPDVPLWMWEEWPVVQGEVVLTYGELEREGKQIRNVAEGTWFATITSNKELSGMEIATGWVEHQGVGATCVKLNRTWDNAYWVAGETKVMVIPNPWPNECGVCKCPKGRCIHEECEGCGGMYEC